MGAGSDLTSRAIAPGSTEYGERGSLEAGLSSAMSGGGGGTGAAGSGSVAAPVPSANDPLGALASGLVVPGGDMPPITDGLSVGPGAGPATMDPMLGDRAERLRMLATNAKSPLLRNYARIALRRILRGTA